MAEWMSRKGHCTGQCPGAVGKVRIEVRPGAYEATSSSPETRSFRAFQLEDLKCNMLLVHIKVTVFMSFSVSFQNKIGMC